MKCCLNNVLSKGVCGCQSHFHAGITKADFWHLSITATESKQCITKIYYSACGFSLDSKCRWFAPMRAVGMSCTLTGLYKGSKVIAIANELPWQVFHASFYLYEKQAQYENHFANIFIESICKL